ncbi:M14 family metallopeptidase [Hyphococcus sp. DH-69]|uniref:M14 family metallopeptidase n=1 Tax=Hyphococcus formosus TaxID=3143534 RepID=UPI00398B08E6
MRTLLIGALVFLSGGLSLPAMALEACDNDLARLDADFDGGRISDCVVDGDSFEIRIDPEDQPINPSPWYSFRVTPKQTGDLKVSIRYSYGKHRYHPKRSSDGRTWTIVDPIYVRERQKGKRVVMTLEMGEEPFIVSAQELVGVQAYDRWEKGMVAQHSFLERKKVGTSVEGRPIYALISTPPNPGPNREYVVLLGRQHPPELTGAFAMFSFVNTVFADTELASRFRDRFDVVAISLMNPDGVANGHWRHNVNGKDLNRDWGPFSQPETQAAQKILDAIADDENRQLRLMLDFHSTKRNLFYTQTKKEKTNPDKFTTRWFEAAKRRFDYYEFTREERRQRNLPTSKNYSFGRFGAPAMTYEVGDESNRAAVSASAVVFAEEMMRTLLSYDEEDLGKDKASRN